MDATNPFQHRISPLKIVGIVLGVMVVTATASAAWYFQVGQSTKGAVSTLADIKAAKPAGTPKIKRALAQANPVVASATQPAKKNLTASSSCLKGQLIKPGETACTCDKANGFYPIVLQNAIAISISTSPASLVCFSCDQISDRLARLQQKERENKSPLAGQALEERNNLQRTAEQNGCNLCKSFDEAISAAEKQKDWDAYYKAVMTKTNDQSCGKKLPACETNTWKLAFALQLNAKLSLDPKGNQEALAKLTPEIKNLRSQLFQASCVDIAQVCQQVTKTTNTFPVNKTSLKNPQIVDLETINDGQLFANDPLTKNIRCRQIKTTGIKRI